MFDLISVKLVQTAVNSRASSRTPCFFSFLNELSTTNISTTLPNFSRNTQPRHWSNYRSCRKEDKKISSSLYTKLYLDKTKYIFFRLHFVHWIGFIVYFLFYLAIKLLLKIKSSRIIYITLFCLFVYEYFITFSCGCFFVISGRLTYLLFMSFMLRQIQSWNIVVRCF